MITDRYQSLVRPMNNEGRFSNSDYEVWDVVPRNVLRDKDGDMYVVDAEIAKKP